MEDTSSDNTPTTAEGWKDLGNAHFKSKRYPDAIDAYTKAIELDPCVPTFYTNRAFAYIRSEAFGAALEDANTALKLEPTLAKGYYRRATANMGLARWKASKRDFEAVLKIHPNDKDAQKKMRECDKIIRQLAFERAIAVESKDTESIVDRMRQQLESLHLPSSYDGPRLDQDERMTPEFAVALIPHFKAGKKLPVRYAIKILLDILELMRTKPSITDVPIAEGGKITVCGDVHGQFYDLCNIFELNGLPSQENPYLFNGDFVDRGSFSVEVIFTMFSFKLAYPDHFHMSRGNHETDNMNKMYGFEGEVKAKYNANMMELFTEVFNALPLGHVIHHKVLVVHGGLPSKDGVKLDELRKINRRKQPDEGGLMSDLLWADPQPQPGRSPSKRGVGMQFGPDVTKRFLEDNGLSLLIRSHEMKMQGYEVAHDGKCITVFSAPNYCDQMGNKGAFITLREDCEPHFTEFEAVPHPDVKPMAYASNFLSMLGGI